MNRVVVPVVAAGLLVFGAGAGAAYAQSSEHTHVGIGVKASTLGYGADVAVPIGSRLNIRGGATGYSLTHDFDNDGITIAGKLKLSAVDAHLDWFPFGGGFHLSPGFVFHNGTKVSGAASVPQGKKFTLNDVDYVSSTSNPVTGNASVDFKDTAPSLLMGWGNLVPRGSRRWSIQFEMGVLFSKQPTFALTLAGKACPVINGVQNANCASPLDVANDPTVKSNLAAQINKVNDDLKPLKVFPVLSLGFGYKF